MSGIFKGDSIYKSGGGGGGYKDGGQLIDGDFIEVKNNTISTYDNESRDPVNFYFEVKDGEILNSVVELTTDVNATINVYILKDGFYYLLGNVGGNTVNAGNDYNLNIIGKSYSLELVTPSPNIPEYADIMGGRYDVAKVGSKLWTKYNFNGIIPGVDYKVENGTTYYLTNVQAIKNFNSDGWHLPRVADVNELKTLYTANSCKQTGTPYSSWNSRATGTAPVLFYPYGIYSPNFQLLGMMSGMLYINDKETKFWNGFSLNRSTDTFDSFNPYDGGAYINIRLVRDA
jgi:hypothetical protein